MSNQLEIFREKVNSAEKYVRACIAPRTESAYGMTGFQEDMIVRATKTSDLSLKWNDRETTFQAIIVEARNLASQIAESTDDMAQLKESLELAIKLEHFVTAFYDLILRDGAIMIGTLSLGWRGRYNRVTPHLLLLISRAMAGASTAKLYFPTPDQLAAASFNADQYRALLFHHGSCDEQAHELLTSNEADTSESVILLKYKSLIEAGIGALVQMDQTLDALDRLGVADGNPADIRAFNLFVTCHASTPDPEKVNARSDVFSQCFEDANAFSLCAAGTAMILDQLSSKQTAEECAFNWLKASSKADKTFFLPVLLDVILRDTSKDTAAGLKKASERAALVPSGEAWPESILGFQFWPAIPQTFGLVRKNQLEFIASRPLESEEIKGLKQIRFTTNLVLLAPVVVLSLIFVALVVSGIIPHRDVGLVACIVGIVITGLVVLSIFVHRKFTKEILAGEGDVAIARVRTQTNGGRVICESDSTVIIVAEPQAKAFLHGKNIPDGELVECVYSKKMKLLLSVN